MGSGIKQAEGDPDWKFGNGNIDHNISPGCGFLWDCFLGPCVCVCASRVI